MDNWNDKLTRQEAADALADRVGKAYLVWEEHGDGSRTAFSSGEIAVPAGAAVLVYSSAFFVNGVGYTPGEDYRVRVAAVTDTTARIEAEWLHPQDGGSGFALDPADQIEIKVEYTFR